MSSYYESPTIGGTSYSTYSTPIPGVPQYGQAANLAKLAYQQALARSNQNLTTSLQNYGYEGTIDAKTGHLSNLHVSANNPMGQYQQMLRSHAMSSQDLAGQAEDRGLHGGLANAMETQARFGYGADEAQLGQSVTGAVSGHADELQQAKYAEDQALYNAEWQAAQDAISSGNYNPADYSQLPNTPYPGTGGPGQIGTGESTKGIKSPFTARDNMIRNLWSRGVMPSAWAKTHPVAAKNLGIGSKSQSNNAAIRHAYGGKPPKRGVR